jgi:ABC-type multidrug transport system fused ATPase/permease subunit
MNQTREQFEGEIRYAQILSERTARMYRRLQTVGTFLSIVGMSAVLATALSSMSDAWTLSAAAVFLISTAIMLTVKPAEKVTRWEEDLQRYRDLMARSKTMTLEQLDAALQDVRRSDAPEVAPLREVAFNQMLHEINRADQLIRLTLGQRVLAQLA